MVQFYLIYVSARGHSTRLTICPQCRFLLQYTASHWAKACWRVRPDPVVGLQRVRSLMRVGLCEVETLDRVIECRDVSTEDWTHHTVSPSCCCTTAVHTRTTVSLSSSHMWWLPQQRKNKTRHCKTQGSLQCAGFCATETVPCAIAVRKMEPLTSPLSAILTDLPSHALCTGPPHFVLSGGQYLNIPEVNFRPSQCSSHF